MPIPAWLAKEAAQRGLDRYAPTTGALVHDVERKVWRFAYITPVAIVGLVVLLAASVAGVSAPPAEALIAGTCPSGADVPSSVDIDGPTIAAINALKPMYEQVGQEKDVPWTLLAAVDYREDGNNPSSSMLSGEPIGNANPDNPGVTTTSKLDSIQKGADHLRAMGSSVYGVTLTASSGGEDIKLAALAYNRGYIYKRTNTGADASPYVMNQYDADHLNMTWPSIDGEPLAGRREMDRYGAYTLFTRLGGSSSSGCGGLSADDVVAIAQQEVGTTEDNPGTDTDDGAPRKYQGNGGPEDWCADFVSWVYMTAGRPFDGGTDGNPDKGVGWRLPGVRQLRAWMIGHGTYQDKATHPYSDAQPGDVVIFGTGEGSHTGIVERVDVDGLHTIEGNSADAVTRRSYPADSTYVQGWGAGPAQTSDAVSGGTGPSTGVTAGADGLPSNWSESTDCTWWNWGVSDPSTHTIHYCADKIDQAGGSDSLWNYVRTHERCHARAYEGLENYDWTNERATEDCAAAHGADVGRWSPYV